MLVVACLCLVSLVCVAAYCWRRVCWLELGFLVLEVWVLCLSLRDLVVVVLVFGCCGRGFGWVVCG